MPRARRTLCVVTDASTPDLRAGRRDPYRLAAGALCALQALVLVGVVVFYVVELARGESDDATRAVMSAVLILVFALLLGVLARGWLRGDNWPSTPTIVWNVLLLPVSWSLLQAGRAVVAVPLLLVALAAVVCSARADTRDRGEDAHLSNGDG